MGLPKNRLEQIANLYDHLVENYGFYMRGGNIRVNKGPDERILDVIACNFVDMQRYLTLDHIKLGQEKPVFFLWEIKERVCPGFCRQDGGDMCYCDGNCMDVKRCGWLRYDGGQEYCHLVCPTPPGFPRPERTYEFYRAAALRACKNEMERRAVERCMPPRKKID